jgi:tetratricopeptide (TPR) repeat protein
MTSTASKLLGLSLALLTAACGGALSEPFTPPESGGAPWVEVTSKHIVLRTDLPADEARGMCVEFEQIYAMFEDIAFNYQEKPKAQTSIVLFRREVEYEAIGPRGSAGFFRRAIAIDDYFAPMAIFHGDLTAATRHLFQHELTHRFIDFYFPRAPVWLHEGLAEYYETMVVEDNHVILGRDLPDRFFIGGLTWTFESTPLWPVIAHIPISDAVSPRGLLKMDREEFYAAQLEASSISEKEERSRRQTANYASAWTLVHLFLNGPAPYPERFAAYLEKLAVNRTPESAFSVAFEDLDDAIERDYRAWLMPKERILRRTRYELPAVQIVGERAMAPADVHVLWASIRPWSTEADRARARADLDAAIRLAPDKVSPRTWMAQLNEMEGKLDEAERHLNQALAVAPGDPAATYALFRLRLRQASQGQGEGRFAQADALFPKVLAVATTPRVQNGAARYLADRQRPDEGLPLALKAVAGDPSCWQCFDTLALLLSQKGAFEKAKEVQSLALSLVPEGVDSSSLMASLQRYEQAAREATASPEPNKAKKPGAAPTGGALGDFNRGAAAKALVKAFAAAKQCKQPNGPTGSVRVKVIFEPSGAVSSAEVLDAPFAGTPTGDCVARAYSAASVPPFSGDRPPVSLIQSFTLE